MARYPERTVQLITLPPTEGQNPKTFKLIAGAKVAWGEVLCVLDDDTMLPDDGLERCLPFLDQPGVGLAFGLPYYVNFSDMWSSMVSTFVNNNSLLTYVPYTVLTSPFTSNGMFYAMRREVLEEVGGFEVIEKIFVDDFAVAYLLPRPSRRTLGYALRYFGYSFGIFAHFNKRYLREASPWHKAWWVPVIQVVFPVQLLIALLSLQRINWRGNIVQVERGGGGRYVRRRTEQATSPTRKS